MSEQDIEKIIKELREKAQSIELVEKSSKPSTIDKKSAWELAKKIRKDLSDDNLSAPHPSRA